VLQSLSAWVPTLFGAAAKQSNKGYRVSSAALDRDLEEDLSFTSQGIKDFGVHDMGDANEGKRSPIDIVLEYGGEETAANAALWLCERLGVHPASLGWVSNGPSCERQGRRASRCCRRRAGNVRHRLVVAADGRTAKQEEREFLLDRLETEPANSDDILAEAKQEGIAQR